MKQITFITANPKSKESSASLQMDEYTRNELIKKYPEAKINIHNFAFEPIQELTANILSGNIGEEEGEILAKRKYHLDDFMESDLVVISMPMWNHNYPAQFKLFIDTLWVPGTTFAYNEHGDIHGLLEAGSKKVLIIASMGGLNYFKGNDYGYAFAKDSFLSFGLAEADIKYVPVQGTALMPQDGHSASIGLEKAVEEGKKLIDFTLTSYK